MNLKIGHISAIDALVKQSVRQYCRFIRQATLPVHAVTYALSLQNHETGNMASPIDYNY